LSEIKIKNKYSAGESFLGTLIYAILLAYIPLCIFVDIGELAFEAYSIAAVALFAFALYKLTSSKRTLISFAIPAGILFLLGGSFVVFAVIVSLMSSVALLACLIYKASSFAARAFPIIITVAVYLLLSVIVGNFVAPVVCFAALPAALTLSVCLYRKTPRVSTVCCMSVAFLLPSVIVFSVWFFAFMGGTLSELEIIIENIRDAAAKAYAQGMISFKMAEDTPDTYAFAKDSMILLFNLLPALLITVSNITAYLLQSFTASMIAHGESDKETIVSLYMFKMSTGSAVVFFIFLILYAVFEDEARPDLAMAALNVVVILIPGLINTTLVTIKRLTYSKIASCFGVIIYVAAIMLLINIPEYSVMIAAIVGAAILILSAVRGSIMKSER
jgi:hypothetical protein